MEAIEKGYLFPGQDTPTCLDTKDALLTRHISEIETDPVGELASTWGVLEELGLAERSTELDCRLIR